MQRMWSTRRKRGEGWSVQKNSRARSESEVTSVRDEGDCMPHAHALQSRWPPNEHCHLGIKYGLGKCNAQQDEEKR